ncbi:MAG: M15 family metallopeptidase [Firmicutes bacterium]|nr:M15 family metallopeptidase [Bacillota bacterium]
MGPKRGRTGGQRRKRRYRIKKRFFVFLLILGLCIFEMVKCSMGLIDSLGEETPDDGIRRTAIETTEDWKLVLVNQTHKLPADHKVETTPMAGYSGYEFDSRAIASLEQMISDAAAEDLEIEVCSAYRTIEYQENLVKAQVAKYIAQGMSQAEAEAKTATEIIEPGASEHNLGLAVDLVAKSYQHLEDDQAETAENKWLLANCTEYGFILRYPQGKQDITGIKYEPWHFRYVGKAAAEEIMSQGICLEEYLGEME